ncbi:Rv3235 family protein [Demequina sp. SYSU T00192]|uniref:Rv3235 family protein n=1 Tax=Demequina litoralis TaxID=3051660 RepID=A0ABT8G6Z0_9MICO|nr:Rv3235 family protein [Demequina sp. SYSU T00192]MDN4474893.1 Rv3235 family protein [Demequina sp. SYSU T00192]
MSAEPAWSPRPERRDVYGRARATLGDPTPLACTVALTAIEVVHGGDGLDTLLRWVTPEVRERLARQHSLARRAGRGGGTNARILRARACRVSRDAAEIAAVAKIAGMSHAVAIRLEDRAGRWVITVLDIG